MKDGLKVLVHITVWLLGSSALVLLLNGGIFILVLIQIYSYLHSFWFLCVCLLFFLLLEQQQLLLLVVHGLVQVLLLLLRGSDVHDLRIAVWSEL